MAESERYRFCVYSAKLAGKPSVGGGVLSGTCSGTFNGTPCDECSAFEEYDENASVVISPLGREVNLISDPLLKRFVSEVLATVPDYFWEHPASSSGKYHPPDHLGKGGLVRHVKKAVELSHKIAETFKLLPQKDLVISALILHDCYKYGDSGKDFSSYKNHGWAMVQLIQKLLIDGKILVAVEQADNPEFFQKLDKIQDAITCHMGIWVGPKEREPKTRIEMCVHLSDLMSAHKMIIFPKEWYV